MKALMASSEGEENGKVTVSKILLVVAESDCSVVPVVGASASLCLSVSHLNLSFAKKNEVMSLVIDL